MGAFGQRPPRLLVCAESEKALDAHCIVLENAHFHVDAALGEAETIELLTSRINSSLIVISYTVVPKHRDAILALAKERHVPTYQMQQFLPPEDLVRNVRQFLRECTSPDETIRSKHAVHNIVPIR